MSENEKNESEKQKKNLWDAMSFADSLVGFGSSMKGKFSSALKSVNETVTAYLATQKSNEAAENDNKTDSNQNTQENQHGNEITDEKFSDHFLESSEKTEEKTAKNEKLDENVNRHSFTGATQSIMRALSNFSVRNTISSFFEYITPDFTPDDPLFENDAEFEECFGVHRGGTKFIDRYTEKDIEKLIRESKLGERLSKIGIDDWYIDFDLSDCFSHYGYLRSRSLPEKDQYIGFLIVQIGEFKLKSAIDIEKKNEDNIGLRILEKNLKQSSLNLLNIRWFSLQDPRAHFTPQRPRLPGQRYPGTGIAREAFNLLVKCALLSKRDGIVNSPEHFHNAFMYEGFLFLNPSDEGKFCAMKRDLQEDIKTKSLAAVSWAIYLGFLRCTDKDGNETKVKWEAREQAFPLSDNLKSYFNSPDYKSTVISEMNKNGHFHIIWEEAESYCLSAILQFSSSECSIK